MIAKAYNKQTSKPSKIKKLTFKNKIRQLFGHIELPLPITPCPIRKGNN